MTRLSILVAMAKNRVIGRGGQLPWRLSADLKRFKALTMGHHLIMGRKTFESIGRPLPGRTSIVLTRQPAQLAQRIGTSGPQLAASLDDALAQAKGDEEVFVVGGAEVYALSLLRADRLYVTWVDADVKGDTFFPELDWRAWRPVSDQSHPADAKNEYATRFVIYDRLTDH